MAKIKSLDGDDLQKMFANPDLFSEYLDTITASSLDTLRESNGLEGKWTGHELPDLEEAAAPVKLSKLVPPILKASKSIAPVAKPIAPIKSMEEETTPESVKPVSPTVLQTPLPRGVVIESPLPTKQVASSRSFEPATSPEPIISQMPSLPKTEKEVAKTLPDLPNSAVKTGDDIRNLGVKTKADMAKKLREREQEIQRLLTDKGNSSISSSSV